MTRIFSLHQVGDVIIQSDVSDQSIANAVSDEMGRIKHAYEVDFSDPQAGDPPDVDTAIEWIKESMDHLKTLAENGITRALDGRQFYMTKPMLEALDDLLRIIDLSGMDLTTGTISVEDRNGFERWRAFLDVDNMIRAGEVSSAINRSLQEMIQTEYLVEANNLIFEEMEDLKERLTISTDILKDLASLQHEKNKVTNTTSEVNRDPNGYLLNENDEFILGKEFTYFLNSGNQIAYLDYETGSEVLAPGIDGFPITMPSNGDIPLNMPDDLGFYGGFFKITTDSSGFITAVDGSGVPQLVTVLSTGKKVKINPENNHLIDEDGNDVDSAAGPLFTSPIHTSTDLAENYFYQVSGKLSDWPDYAIQKDGTGTLLNAYNRPLRGGERITVGGDGYLLYESGANVKDDENNNVHVDSDYAKNILGVNVTTRANLIVQEEGRTVAEILSSTKTALGEPITLIPDPTFGGAEPTGTLVTMFQTIDEIRQRIQHEYLPFLEENRPINPATGEKWDKPPPGSMEEKLIQVLAELPITEKSEYETDPTTGKKTLIKGSIEYWLVDNLDQEGNVQAALSGNLQLSLTTAIVSAQNISDEQKEELKRVFFLFEEFYKSAAIVIKQVKQIIERMATNVSGR